MSHNKTNVTSELKRVNPFVNEIVANLRASKDFNLNDLETFNDAFRISFEKAKKEALIEQCITADYKRFTESEHDVAVDPVWREFVIALYHAINTVIHDTDFTYLKSKFYAIYEGGLENTDHATVKDLILELALLETSKRKAKAVQKTEELQPGLWTRFRNWWTATFRKDQNITSATATIQNGTPDYKAR